MAKNNTGDDNTGYGNSGDRNSGYGNSGNGNSGNGNSGNGNSGYGNSGNWNSGNGNSGYRNSGDWNSGYGNSGYRNSGNWNSTNRESGIFNSKQGTVRMFNKDSGKTWNEIDHPHFNEFWLNRWIDEDDMTDQEKSEQSAFHTRGGYLKTFEWGDAWKNFWRDTSKENRKKFLDLPNFDAEVFKDITGIDVDKPKKETIKIGDLEYNKEDVEKRLKDIKPL